MNQCTFSTTEEKVQYLKNKLIFFRNSQVVNQILLKETFKIFRQALNDGVVRSVTRHKGEWKAEAWVKEFILLGLKYGLSQPYTKDHVTYFEKETLPLKKIEQEHKIRFVPGGSAIRDGCFIGQNVVLMAPIFVNIGAYIDEDSMIDSHVLIGSCAHIGKNAHIGAGSQIGGVLDPVGSMPVLLEDDVFVGGNCGIYCNVIIKSGVVLGAGTIITDHTPIYDLVHNKVYRGTREKSLVIPKNAVVVPGSRSYSVFEGKEHLSINTPIITKYSSESIEHNMFIRKTMMEDSMSHISENRF